AGDNFLRGLLFERPCRAPHELGQSSLIGRSGQRGRAEVLLDVALRTEEALFFAGPESNADRAARLDAQRLENAHSFHGDDGSRAIVGCASACDPAIQM